MTRIHLAVSLTLAVFACAGLWRATGWEAAQAGGRLSEEEGRASNRAATWHGTVGLGPVGDAKFTVAVSPSSESLYQGKPAIWWARRAVQARKDANARGRTIRRLQSAQRHDAAHFFAWLRAADCVHRHEANWDHNGATYDGGMQADASFQRAYGVTYLRRWGPAYLWPWWAQLHMAYNGWLARGWQPWPTRRYCGL